MSPLEIDERETHDRWMSVIVFGRYEELPDDPEFEAARLAAYEVLQKRAMWWEPACVPTEQGDVPHSLTPIFYRIHIEHISGRRATPDKDDQISESVESPKHEQSWLDKILHRDRTTQTS